MKEKVKCERCGRIRDLFKLTESTYSKEVVRVRDNGIGARPRFTEHFVTEQFKLEPSECRGLCEECAVEINKRNYDKEYET